MLEQTPKEIWALYGEAWTDLSAEKRQDCLRLCVAEDCRFANQLNEGTGRANLGSVMEAFQRQTPGGYFTTQRFLQHHRFALADWEMYAKNGERLLAGTNVVEFASDGRIEQVLGFWEQK